MARARKFTSLTGGGAGALDAWAGTDLVSGDIAMVMSGGFIYFYELDAGSGAPESSPSVIAPDTDAGTKRWLLRSVPGGSSVPVGTIVAFQTGYYATSANEGFTSVWTNTPAGVNAIVGGSGWRVCNGDELNLPGSPIYGGAGRRLPNLTNSRFLMGSTTTGVKGGSNASIHTHQVISFSFASQGTVLTEAQIPPHTHNYTAWTPGAVDTAGVHTAGRATAAAATTATGGGQAHNHLIVMPTFSVGDATDVNNIPQYLTCFYIQKVI